MKKKINRPALRYRGSKFRLADWLLPFLPPHRVYCEPFCGGLNMLLRKPQSKIEVVNDLDDDVINFFKVLRDMPGELEKFIQLTPYSRQELINCRFVTADAPPLERARALYVRAWQGFSGPQAQGNPGWRFDACHDDSSCLKSFYDTKHLPIIAERLKKVEFENNDALVIIKNFDKKDVLFFVDPPYFQDHLAEGDKSYQFMMSEAEHRVLAETLHNVEGMVMLSGYPSPLYTELYGDWHHEMKGTTTDHNKKVTECLWLNPAAKANSPKSSFFEMWGNPDAIQNESSIEDIIEVIETEDQSNGTQLSMFG